MSQCELDRAVARATGETVTEIRRLGFSLVVPESHRPEPLPQILRMQQPRKAMTYPIKRAA